MDSQKLTDLFKRISFGDGNFISLGNNSCSFRVNNLYPDIPDDVHLTIGYNPQTGEANLHVTRNVSDLFNKPKVVIAVFHVESLEKQLPQISSKITRAFFPPVKFNKRKLSSRWRKPKPEFVDLANVERDSNYRGSEFLREAKIHFTKKGGNGKYQLKDSLVPGIEQWSEKKFGQTIRKSVIPLNEIDVEKQSFGYLNLPEYKGAVIIVNGKMHKVQVNKTMYQFAEILFGKNIAAKLRRRFDQALRIVSDAKDYSETENFHNPIRLFN